MTKNLKNSFHPYSKETQLYRIPKKSLRDSKAIKEFKKKYPKCIICNEKADAHHVKTRGAGGANHKDNLTSFCRKHHSELHQIGKVSFRKKYKLFIENWEGRKK